MRGISDLTRASIEQFEDAEFVAILGLASRTFDNGANFVANELEAFATYETDVECIRAAEVRVRLLESRDSRDEYSMTCAWLGKKLGLPIEFVSGNHAPYLQHPEVFAEELRPILRQLSAPIPS